MDRNQAMRGTAASTPEEWFALWSGWQRTCAETLRNALLSGAAFELNIKWGNLVFFSGGPCALIHVEEPRVVLGFWRGKRLVDLDPGLKPGGKYELANIVFGPDSIVDPARIGKLAAAAAALNAELGDPTAKP